MEISEMTLFEKMAAITAELKTVAKNLELVAGGGKYKAVSERDILDAVKPMEEKYRIYSYPVDREILESSMFQSESTYNGKTTTKTTFFTRIKTTYRFVDIDSPDEHIDMVTFAEGIDTQDKGSGKAMTYSDKYALMKAYKISTGDDPDQDPSEGDNYKKVSENKRQEKKVICSGCNKEITDAVLKNGGVMKKEEVAQLAMKNLGAPYCAECQMKMTRRDQ